MKEALALGKRHGWDGDYMDWGSFADRWRKEGYTAAIGRIARGEEAWARVDELHRRMLDVLLAEHSIFELDEAEVADFNRVWHRLEPWPDAVAGLTRLKERYTIAPLSNGDFALLTTMARHAALPWDCILSAELFRAYKPQPEVYLGAVDLLGLKPVEVMMVAAHPGDLEAARAVGLRTAYVPRPLEYGAGAAAPLHADALSRFDVVADDFLMLANVLG